MRQPYELTLTTPEHSNLTAFLDHLVQQHLCAAAHLDHIHTTYWWEGEMHHGTEQRAALHTCQDCIEVISQRLTSWHPYQVPCLVGHPLDTGHPDYLQWIQDQVQDPRGPVTY